MEQTLVQALTDENGMNYGDTCHTILTSGFAYCDVKDKIYREFTARTKAIKEGTTPNVGCSIDLSKTTGEHTTVQIGKYVSSQIGNLARQSCVAKYKVMMVIFCYAIREHPECTGYHKMCNENIAEFEKTINTRIQILNLTPVSI